MVRYASIGTSWIARAFHRACLLTGQGVPAAVYSRDETRGREFAAEFGCDTVYTDLDALAADPVVDAVYIASPNSLHYEQSKKMLAAGKHVICEKPIVTDPDEFRELSAYAAAHRLVYMEALMGRHLPGRQALIDTLPTIGRLCRARFDFSQRSSKYDRLMAGERFNVFDPAMAGGVLWDLGIYCVYPCVDLFGMPRRVQAYGVPLFTGVDGTGGAILHYDGFTAELTYSKTGQSEVGSEIIGDAGAIVIPSISTLNGMSVRYADGRRAPLTGELDKPELMRPEAADFFRYIEHFDETAAEREADTALAEQVSELMKAIRAAM